LDEAERLSSLIGGIYDAALDPGLWPVVLRKASAFVNGSAAALFAKDATSKTGVVYYDDGGVDPHYTQLYFEKYVKLDPSTTGHFFAEVEQPYATADIMPYEEFLDTRFYKEWAQPQGLVDFISAVLDKSVTSAAMFGVFRAKRHGVADEPARRAMRLIVPHIRRAVLVSRTIELKSAAADTFAAVLDGLSAGMFLVDAEGRIVHANASGHALLAEGGFLRAVSGRLAPRNADADQALKAAFTASGVGDDALGITAISVPLTAEDGARYVAHVLPLTSGARSRTGSAFKAAAAVFVHRASLDTKAPPEIIAKTHKLTPTELRVLLAIVQVGGVPEVAESLGVAESTIKTHVKRLYRKTDTNRHADLVKLVAFYSSPLAN
jgi:DNA-binding CsgD family transcriptional regulator/PAS domain-containing protein